MNVRWLTAVALVCIATVATLAQVSTKEQMAVDAYRAAIRSAESGRATRSIESAFSALKAMHDALLKTQHGRSVLESLSDGEFQRLQQLPGTIINREEVLLVEHGLVSARRWLMY